jgi:thioredoxin-like negative regulator of GroEL
VNDLEPHDLMRLNAADGWLGFDNVIEADKELKQITPTMQGHPEVLARRCEMFAKAECWPKCEEVAEEIILLQPESTFGWIRRSFALHEQNLTATAREKLLPAVDLSPEDISIRYNLACYECVLGNMSQARLHLAGAFNLAHNQNCTDEWKSRMLGDPDLKPLWGIWDEVEI